MFTIVIKFIKTNLKLLLHELVSLSVLKKICIAAGIEYYQTVPS
jgi:hypothetical protein